VENATLAPTFLRPLFTPRRGSTCITHFYFYFYFYFYKGCTGFNEKKKKQKRKEKERIKEKTRGDCRRSGRPEKRAPDSSSGVWVVFRHVGRFLEREAGSRRPNLPERVGGFRCARECRTRAQACGWVSGERGGLGKARATGESGQFQACGTLRFLACGRVFEERGGTLRFRHLPRPVCAWFSVILSILFFFSLFSSSSAFSIKK
jgi:hypothetical protein